MRKRFPRRLRRRRRKKAEQAHNFETGGSGNQKISVDIPNIDRNDIDFFSDISEQGEADKKYYISKREEKVLNCWNEFIHGIKKCRDFPFGLLSKQKIMIIQYRTIQTEKILSAGTDGFMKTTKRLLIHG